MRNIFTALIKIIGIWIIYLGVKQLNDAVFNAIKGIITNAWGIPSTMMPQYKAWSGVYLLLSGVYFIFAWVLIFKTDWVADKVKVPKDENSCTPLDRFTLLPVGIQVLGIYFVLTVTYNLIYWLIEVDGQYSIRYCLFVGLPCIAQLCLAIMCTFKADAIVKFISDKVNISWTKMAALSLLAAGILVILIRILVSAMATDH